MPKRVYQKRFDETLKPTLAQDVTPEGYAEVNFPVPSARKRRNSRVRFTQSGGDMGRFVREVKENVQITSPKAAAEYLQANIYTPFEQFDQEEMWVVLLNTKNIITHVAMVYRGTLNSAVVRVAEIFKEAVRVNASGLIMSHCHPSGDPIPSPEDVLITKQAVEAADILSISFEDHIIVGKEDWVSLREHGLGFELPTKQSKPRKQRRINED